MHLVYKCDHCPDTNKNSTVIAAHEPECPFNPVNKKCYSCHHEFEDGYPISGHSPGCEKGFNPNEGEEIGNCKGWKLKE